MMTSTLSKKALVLSALVLLVLWQTAAAYLHAPLILPSPVSVFQGAAQLLAQKKFIIALLYTAKRCLEAFTISVVAGMILGVLCAFIPFCSAFFELPLAIIRSVPVVAVILLALFWLKTDEIPIFAAILMSLPVMKTCVQTGFSSCSKDVLHMAHVYRLTRLQIFLFIRIPHAYDSICTGIKNCAGMTWKVVAAGEVLSLPSKAVGTYMQNAQAILETEQVLAITALIIAASFLFSLAIQVLLHSARKAGIACTRWYFSIPLFFCRQHSSGKQNDTMHGKEIHIEHLNLGYEEKKLIFKDFSLDVPASEILAILAPSGCGKTTLLNYIASQNNYGNKAYIFQEPRLIKQLTVLQNILLPLSNCMSKRDALKHATSYLEKTGLLETKNTFPEALSGGERQRVSLARAFTYPAGILLMDEPFQSQDSDTKEKLMHLFASLQKEQNRTVIMVTHTPSEAESLAHRTLKLQGRPVTVIETLKKH